jgi:hypothetical protein
MIDVDALRTAVQMVDPETTIHADPDHDAWTVRAGGFTVDVYFGDDELFVTAVRAQSSQDRAVLRAVLDEIDRQGFR